jgi:hypothetical protein
VIDELINAWQTDKQRELFTPRARLGRIHKRPDAFLACDSTTAPGH